MAKFKDIQLLRTTYLRGPSVWTYRPVLEVWLERPSACWSGDDITWIGSGDVGLSSKIASWSLDECRREVGTVPETARECLHRV